MVWRMEKVTEKRTTGIVNFEPLKFLAFTFKGFVNLLLDVVFKVSDVFTCIF